VQGFESNTGDWDEPEQMLDELISHQRRLISGFKGDPRCEEERWREAASPRHVAISLAGEPALYPYLGDLIQICHQRGMTTFVVTNGTEPRALEALDPLPTQLYVTVAAPNKEIYRKVCAPLIPDGWERLMSTLDLLPSLDTRTVIRHTLVKDLNLGWEEEYARLDDRAAPTFVEPKGYVFVGGSRTRLSLSNMPSHTEIRDFAVRIGERLSLDILNERTDSRVVLLGEKLIPARIPGIE